MDFPAAESVVQSITYRGARVGDCDQRSLGSTSAPANLSCLSKRHFTSLPLGA